MKHFLTDTRYLLRTLRKQPGFAIVMRHGIAVAGIGMVIGLATAFGLSRFLESIVFGVSTRDPMVFGTVVVVLAGVTLTAGYLPARRATRVNPSGALRSE